MVDIGESLCNTNICKAKIKCTAIITANLSRALLRIQIHNIKKMKRGREGGVSNCVTRSWKTGCVHSSEQLPDRRGS